MLAKACFLRLSARRLFSSSPTSIVSSSSSGSKSTSRVLAVWKEATAREKRSSWCEFIVIPTCKFGVTERVSWKQYFESDYFWNEANVGPFFLFLFSVPYLYGGLKTVYSTFKYRRLNEQEIISDRLTWLHERFLCVLRFFIFPSTRELSRAVRFLFFIPLLLFFCSYSAPKGEDEVESVLLQQVPPDGFDRSRPGLLLGPSIV